MSPFHKTLIWGTVAQVVLILAGIYVLRTWVFR
jgi:hypothetical protein